MSFSSKLKSTMEVCTIHSWKKYKEKQDKYDDFDNIALFDMRNLVPGRRITQLSRQLTNTGYHCLFYYPTYYYWLKSLFFRNLNYWNIDLKPGTVIDRIPDNCELLITRDGTNKILNCKTIYFNNRIMDRIDKIKHMPFYYPILMHPQKSRIEFEKACLNSDAKKKQIGILFIGNNDDSYKKNTKTIHDRYHVHTRTEVIDYLKNNLGEYVYCPSSYDELADKMAKDLLTNRIVIVEKFRLNNEYFDLLNSSRCFICTAGVVMPFCHNHIESIACGCIPIIEFASFYPGMKDICITYNGFEELAKWCKGFCREERCNTENLIERSEMVKKYYKQYWSIESFKRKLMKMNEDQIYYVADNYLK